jgi:drug/metabolite transporter (DMT)-like permease
VLVYFYPASFPAQQIIGLAIGLVGMLANALASILGRSANRSRAWSPYTVTIVSMGVGSGALLLAGLVVEGLPVLGLRELAIVGWLALVHTALAFTLWNHTLRTLTAVESSVINGTMLIQIALLAWIFLDERITSQGIVGLALAAAGVLVVQLSRGVVIDPETE